MEMAFTSTKMVTDSKVTFSKTTKEEEENISLTKVESCNLNLIHIPLRYLK